MPNSGFSMVELLVSVAIGLLLVLGATTVYVNSSKTSDTDETNARLQEAARYALSVIENDARMANYWGLIKIGAAIKNKLNNDNPATNLVTAASAQACGNNYAIDVEKYVAGTNNSYGLGCAANTSAVSSTDTLTIRRAARPISTRVDNRLRMCSNRTDALIIKGNTCADELHDLIVNGYYVDQQSDQNASYPSLRRKMLGLNSAGTEPGFSDVEVIPGIQDLQVQFGWDSTGGSIDTATGTAVQYVNPNSAVLAGGQIVAVRIWLLVRAELPDATYTDTRTYQYADIAAYTPNDHYRRLLVSRTIFLRNIAGT